MSLDTDSTTSTGRDAVTTNETAVSGVVADGMTVAIGGFINSGHPMAAVRQIIRSGVTGLRLVGAASAGLEVDMLVAAGCVETVVAPYVGAEGLAAVGPAFRRAVQDGTVTVFELDEATYYAGLRAAAQCLPFNPWRAGLGTSLPELNPHLVEFEDPINGERLLAVPAIDIDVAFLHAAVSDPYGNVQHRGTGYGDRAIAAAATRTIVTVEQLVSNEEIRKNPAATTVAGASAVIRAPFGAHPFASDGYYPPDREHLRAYLEAAEAWLKTGSRVRLDAYLEQYVTGPSTHFEYLERIGVTSLLSLSDF